LAKPDTQKECKDLHPDLGNQTGYRHWHRVENSRRHCTFGQLKAVRVRVKVERRLKRRSLALY
jgi:hypothetical protein